MNDVKCTCGHVNPPGTTICESCSKPLGEHNDQLLNMRYEGMARRSEQKSKSIFNYIWSFFSSVRNAVWMIIITLIASIVGTVLPQEAYKNSTLPSDQFYVQTYGWFGEVYYKLGFHNLFTSWWYITLLLMIGISLVICSIDRVIPLYRALHKQRIPKNINFYQRQRFFTSMNGTPDLVDTLEESLRKHRYKIKRTEDGVLAEKGRISRWGPYVVHIGLILLILSVLMRLIPGFYYESKELLWLWPGETKKVPGTDYYVKNEEFIHEVYTQDEFPQELNLKFNIDKNFQTNAVLYEKENQKFIELTRSEIQVNHPLKYKGLLMYQASYTKTQQVYSLKFNLMNKSTNQVIGDFVVNIFDPIIEYDLDNGYKVKISEYYKDFATNDKNQPYSISNEPNNPGIIFSVISPDNPNGEVSMFVFNWFLENLDSNSLTPDNKYSINLVSGDSGVQTGLMIMIDRSYPYLIIASLIVVLGLVQGLYFQHRRVWLKYENGALFVAAHTNKNWFGLRRELERMAKETSIELPLETLDQGGKHK